MRSTWLKDMHIDIINSITRSTSQQHVYHKIHHRMLSSLENQHRRDLAYLHFDCQRKTTHASLIPFRLSLILIVEIPPKACQMTRVTTPYFPFTFMHLVILK